MNCPPGWTEPDTWADLAAVVWAKQLHDIPRYTSEQLAQWSPALQRLALAPPTVCPAWEEFSIFRPWFNARRPKLGHSLRRYDPRAPWSPHNAHFVDWSDIEDELRGTYPADIRTYLVPVPPRTTVAAQRPPARRPVTYERKKDPEVGTCFGSLVVIGPTTRMPLSDADTRRGQSLGTRAVPVRCSCAAAREFLVKLTRLYAGTASRCQACSAHDAWVTRRGRAAAGEGAQPESGPVPQLRAAPAVEGAPAGGSGVGLTDLVQGQRGGSPLTACASSRAKPEVVVFT